MTTLHDLVTSQPDPLPARRLLTAANLAALPSDLPSGPVRYELHHGRLVIMAPPGDVQAAVASNLTTELKTQGERRGLGKARGEVGVVLARNPDNVLDPDTVFVANASLPIRRSPEGYLETIPDLVVDIRSKNDTGPEVQAKVDEYVAAGVRVVWVVDPKTRTIAAHRRDKPPQFFSENDTLVVEDIIPGFKMAVAEVFKE